MLDVFLSYSRADGSTAATRLRAELTQAGFNIWRDIEEMRGGDRWKEQLRAAIRKTHVVLVLLTPRAVESQIVNWEWDNALTLEKKVIPLLMINCRVPSELDQFHYHDLTVPEKYSNSLMALIRDLNLLAEQTRTDSRGLSKTSPDVTMNDGFYQPGWKVGTVVQNSGDMKRSANEDGKKEE